MSDECIEVPPTVSIGREHYAKHLVDNGAVLTVKAYDDNPEETLERDTDGSYVRRWGASAVTKEAGHMNHGQDFSQAFRFLYSDRWPTIHVTAAVAGAGDGEGTAAGDATAGDGDGGAT
jgi:hypothetical protein